VRSPGETEPVDRPHEQAGNGGGRLRDAHGRIVSDLRVSVTDRCNFRCQYCMPAEGLPWLDRDEILSFEEIERLVGLLVSLGIEDVRLTGGEPLVRRDFPALVSMLRRIDRIRDLSLTTNAYLLERDAAALVEAGIDRVNVSIDSLARDRFFQITRRDALPQVLRGLEAIAAYERVRPIKVNAVAMRDFTEAEVMSFAELARTTDYQVRFIELIPLLSEVSLRHV
jgi:cyclic pyranopterin phosphate synthase